HVEVSGAPGRLEGDLLHASAESIARYIEKQNRYTTLQAELLHARGVRSRAAAMLVSPLTRFLRYYVLRLGFLDGTAGYAHAAIGAFASFLKHVKLRALERNATEGNGVAPEAPVAQAQARAEAQAQAQPRAEAQAPGAPASAARDDRRP
ncbi:MAG: hypothetical protein ACREX6_10465, partial [Casimicrobiaceae bacterium]